MTNITRRSLLAAGAASLFPFKLFEPALIAKEKAENSLGPIRITKIDVHNIQVPYVDWIHYDLNHFYGPSKRTIYEVHTNKKGLVGLGESGSPEAKSVVESYIGTNPFSWIGDEKSLGLGTAMYDLMGKAAGVPVYKLFGQRQRRFVPVGSWTVSTHPDRMALAVKKYAARGYTWLKYHLSPFENVFDQLKAIQKVAPKGFRVQFDLTGLGTTDHVPELCQNIGKFPVAGCFEDPLPSNDIEGYIELRKRIKLPVILHHSPLGPTTEVGRRAADGYILGHAKIGVAMRKAGLMAGNNMRFMLQNVGGHITRTMTTHMQAAFKTADLHFHCDAETWKADVVNEKPDPVHGFLRVPEKPGLGVTLNRKELERLKALRLPEKKKWIIKTTFANGSKMYNIADPKQSIFMVRPDVRKLIPMRYDLPVKTKWWDDDGSEAYKKMFKRIEKEGLVLEK